MSFHAPKEYLIEHPILGIGYGNNGYFRFVRNNIIFNCISSDGEGFEHVSVSLNKKRTPSWEEMCLVKDIFWDFEDWVIQYHPSMYEYVNNHKYVLHLWRPIESDFPKPHHSLVGIK